MAYETHRCVHLIKVNVAAAILSISEQTVASRAE